MLQGKKNIAAITLGVGFGFFSLVRYSDYIWLGEVNGGTLRMAKRGGKVWRVAITIFYLKRGRKRKLEFFISF